MSDQSEPQNPPDAAESENQATGRWVTIRHTAAWRPPTDIYEVDDHLIVVVEIGGMRDGDFTVTLHGKQLLISGIRRRETKPNCAYHQLEIPYGEFRTEVRLPWPVARDDVSASYHDGFLRIELPHAPTQKVAITDADSDSDHDR
ncbi:MAG: Hsp20/alpha crystallin family protein [Chloroflexi bacterium]|nr:Hsp20/alpha crystallin family protein [Chloroflexota bacterium]